MTELRQVRTASGATIEFRDTGTGPTLLFVHGLFTNGSLWREVVPGLSARYRCITPDWPFGSHRLAVGWRDADPPAAARLIAEFMAALDLHDVVLVANDTGGAIAQLVAVDHPERLAGLVLTPCDAFTNFLPAILRPLQYLAHVPPLFDAVVRTLRLRPLRRLPVAYGWLGKRPVPPALTDDWLRPFLTDPAIRRDTVRFVRAIDHRHTVRAARELPGFTRPVLLAWATEDRFFPVTQAHRLAELLPRARVELVADSYTLVPLDQPDRLVELITDFVDHHVNPRPEPTHREES